MELCTSNFRARKNRSCDPTFCSAGPLTHRQGKGDVPWSTYPIALYSPPAPASHAAGIPVHPAPVSSSPDGRSAGKVRRWGSHSGHISGRARLRVVVDLAFCPLEKYDRGIWALGIYARSVASKGGICSAFFFCCFLFLHCLRRYDDVLRVPSAAVRTPDSRPRANSLSHARQLTSNLFCVPSKATAA